MLLRSGAFLLPKFEKVKNTGQGRVVIQKQKQMFLILNF